MKKSKKKKKKKKEEDAIQILGQSLMHPRKRLEMANKIKNIKKDHQEENEVEITMELNNQNKLKQADKMLKHNIKKEIEVLEDNIHYTKKKNKST